MKVKQKLISLAVVLCIGGGIVAISAPPAAALVCGDTKTSIIGGNVCDGIDNESGDAKDNGIWKLLILVLNIMTAGVGILAVGGIVYGSILYTTASDKAEQTKKAIGLITNVVLGLIAYALMYLVLNFLIPGGIFA